MALGSLSGAGFRPAPDPSIDPAVASAPAPAATSGSAVEDPAPAAPPATLGAATDPNRDAIALASREITSNPAPADYWPEEVEVEAGKTFLAEQQPAIQEILKTLSPRERQAYQRVEKALVNPIKGDREGADQIEGEAKHFQAKLANLLLDGRLISKDLKGEKTLLDRLDQLATQPLAKGLTRVQVLRELVEETEDSLKITQGGKGVCAPASLTVMLAQRSPAEYAGLVADLARPEGKATLQDGSVIQREKDWMNGTTTSTTKLLWPALMELGNGLDFDYDSTRDRNVPLQAGQGRAEYSGLEQRLVSSLAGSLTGGTYETIYKGQVGRDPLEEIRAAVDRGSSVPVSLVSAGGSHAVIVTAFTAGRVQYVNPHGQAEWVTEADFKTGALAYSLPK